MKKLTRSFYYQNGLELSKALLGKVLVHKTALGTIRCIITETEAYMGVIDKASHAYNGLRSNRTETMYHKGGTSYVYLIYGMYHCMNVVANHTGIPEAVLIRGVVPYDEASKQLMLQLHPVKQEKHLSDGPGKLCLAMSIDRLILTMQKKQRIILGVSICQRHWNPDPVPLNNLAESFHIHIVQNSIPNAHLPSQLTLAHNRRYWSDNPSCYPCIP